MDDDVDGQYYGPLQKQSECVLCEGYFNRKCASQSSFDDMFSLFIKNKNYSKLKYLSNFSI